MKKLILKLAAGTALLSAMSPALADLIYVDGTQTPGTGLGNVSTVVTVRDNGTGGGNPDGNNNGNDNGNGNHIQSGCVFYTAGDPGTPGEVCPIGLGVPNLEGGDNHSGNAGNNAWLLSGIMGLTNANQLGLVVNISEGAPGNSATLTHLYFSLLNTVFNTREYFEYMGPDLVLTGNGGIGNSGDHRFVLDGAQALIAASHCPILSQCVLDGGIQFAEFTTEATQETMYVGAFTRRPGTPGGGEVPEPGSVALMGLGALAFTALRRRSSAKKLV